MADETYYSLLEISETASAAEIKAAYLRLIREVHPDRLANAPAYWQRQAEEKSKEINEAYTVLSNREKRRLYDAQLTSYRGSRQTASGRPASPPPRPAINQLYAAGIAGRPYVARFVRSRNPGGTEVSLHVSATSSFVAAINAHECAIAVFKPSIYFQTDRRPAIFLRFYRLYFCVRRGCRVLGLAAQRSRRVCISLGDCFVVRRSMPLPAPGEQDFSLAARKAAALGYDWRHCARSTYWKDCVPQIRRAF